ncbi:MAG: hypothetical protein QNL33_02255 [Akkermansiaceae bacterium]
MSVGWFTSSSLDEQFTWCDNIGEGHPDPDICFAEGKFCLATLPEGFGFQVELKITDSTLSDAGYPAEAK